MSQTKKKQGRSRLTYPVPLVVILSLGSLLFGDTSTNSIHVFSIHQLIACRIRDFSLGPVNKCAKRLNQWRIQNSFQMGERGSDRERLELSHQQHNRPPVLIVLMSSSRIQQCHAYCRPEYSNVMPIVDQWSFVYYVLHVKNPKVRLIK